MGLDVVGLGLAKADAARRYAPALVTAPLHAEKFGARPDRTAAQNNAALAAMVAALPAAGGDMKLGSGELTISAPITLPSGRRGLTLSGQGAGGSRLKLADGANCDVITYTGVLPSTNPGGTGGFTNPANFDYLTIADLMIDGNKAAQTGTSNGINLSGADYFLIDRLYVVNCRSTGIRLAASDEGVVSSALLSGNGWQATSASIQLLNATHDVTIIGVGIENSVGAGVHFAGSFECEIVGANMWGNYRHILAATSGSAPHDLKITGGLYELSTAEAISMVGAKHQIHGAKVMGAGTVGIALADVTDSQVIGVMVDGPTAGIVESGSANRNQLALNRVFSGGITVTGANTVQTANMLA